MSYLDRKHASNRTATIIAAAVIEAAAIYAVVQGLSGTFTRQPLREPLVGEQIKLDPPTPPVPHPAPSARPSPRPDHVTTHKNDFDMVVPSFTITPLPLPSAIPVPLPTPDVVIIEPLQPPTFPPRKATPVGRVSTWATTNDYPTRDLREGNMGVTGFRLTIGADGKVRSCTITSSSGFPGLDKATCDNISRRARFEPATDASGAKVPGSYANNIRWVIPE
jgi:periplasmic protein TonB